MIFKITFLSNFMKTKIFEQSELKQAAQLIKQGEVVAFPTETVYGLGANALDKHAVKKIFKAKGRPSDNPLIIHIAYKKDVKKLVSSLTPIAKKIIKECWPGPLTIILPKSDIVPYETTAGLETVAIRMPKSPIALSLIKEAGVPIAAPSANISTKPSGTTFDAVHDDFDGKIAGIIKGNKTAIGVESTVIDLTCEPPLLLRPGGMHFETLKKRIPKLQIHKPIKNQKPKSPGQKYKHYAPNAHIILFEKSAYPKLPTYKKNLEKKGKKVAIIHPKNSTNFSKELFSSLRTLDKESTDYILITSIPEKELGLAIMNRIRKAATKIIR